MNGNNILFHCSSLGKLMVEPRSKSETLSETTKAHLINVFIENKYGRKKDIANKYIEKGLAVEEDSLTLYSRLTRKIYFKNEEVLSNEFIIGEPDTSDTKDIRKCKVVIDTKSSWDLFTFWSARVSQINKDYWWQMQGYLELTGAEKGILAYCLINTPQPLIYDEQRKLQWKMGVVNPETNKDYQDACNEIEKNMVYDDIPLSERMFEIQINRDDKSIQLLYERIKKCREYMNNHLFIREPEEIDLAA